MTSISDTLEKQAIPKPFVTIGTTNLHIGKITVNHYKTAEIVGRDLAAQKIEEGSDIVRLKALDADLIEFKKWQKENSTTLTKEEKEYEPKNSYEQIMLQNTAYYKNIAMLALCLTDAKGKPICIDGESTKRMIAVLGAKVEVIEEINTLYAKEYPATPLAKGDSTPNK